MLPKKPVVALPILLDNYHHGFFKGGMSEEGGSLIFAIVFYDSVKVRFLVP